MGRRSWSVGVFRHIFPAYASTALATRACRFCFCMCAGTMPSTSVARLGLNPVDDFFGAFLIGENIRMSLHFRVPRGRLQPLRFHPGDDNSRRCLCLKFQFRRRGFNPFWGKQRIAFARARLCALTAFVCGNGYSYTP